MKINIGVWNMEEKSTCEKCGKKLEKSISSNSMLHPNGNPKCPIDEYPILKNPKIFDLIDGELEKTIENEKIARRATLLSCLSVFVKGAQLNTCLTDESSAGKSWIAKQIIRLFPESFVEYYTKMTPEAFTYLHPSDKEPDFSWDGKICYLEDTSNKLLDCQVFKVMASEGSRAAVVMKQQTVVIDIHGQPMMLITTASATPNIEVANRFNFISLDRSEGQTRSVLMRIGRNKKRGKTEVYSEQVKGAIQRLERVAVKIPYAEKIAESYPSKFVRARRDITRFFNLIEASAAIHQYQRKKDNEDYVIATIEDYNLAKEVYGAISSSTQYGLPFSLKRAFEACQKMMENGKLFPKAFTLDEIAAAHPFLTRSNWDENLSKLAERGLLTIDLEKNPDTKRDIRKFKVVGDLHQIELPELNEQDLQDAQDRQDTQDIQDVEKQDAQDVQAEHPVYPANFITLTLTKGDSTPQSEAGEGKDMVSNPSPAHIPKGEIL